MIKAKVLGKVKPETMVCLNGKNNLFFVEDDMCFTNSKDFDRFENPKIGDTVYFDEWFWRGDIRQLKAVL